MIYFISNFSGPGGSVIELFKHVYVGLGSNLGDREKLLNQAIARIGENPLITISRVSSVFETEPWGREDQPEFLNQVIEINTEMQPQQLLEFLQQVEKTLGRERRERWTARSMDLDLLIFGDRIIDSKQLTLPHPELRNRRFVLEPLAELAPELKVPKTGKTVSELLALCTDAHWVKKWAKPGEGTNRENA